MTKNASEFFTAVWTYARHRGQEAVIDRAGSTLVIEIRDPKTKKVQRSERVRAGESVDQAAHRMMDKILGESEK